jgi:hypothetical protein
MVENKTTENQTGSTSSSEAIIVPLSNTSIQSLTPVQQELLILFFEKHFESTKGLFNNKDETKFFLDKVSKEMNLPLEGLTKLYKKGKNSYFASMKRLPAETMINQINTEGQALKEAVFNDSTKDIIAKSHEIMDINDKIAKVNQLYNVSPTTNIFFQQDFKPEDLLNPKNYTEEN